ncbi:hypothetical protein, partial [Heyndrickxia acidicola]|nr:hypothetical protein [Heyndrickxia acidicola]
MSTKFIASYILIAIVLLVIINLIIRKGRTQKNEVEENNTIDRGNTLQAAEARETHIDTTPVKAEAASAAVDEEKPAMVEKGTDRKPVKKDEVEPQEKAGELIAETLQEAPNSASAVEYVNEEIGQAKESTSAPGQKEPDL